MTVAGISDVQLERLLGHVPSPLAPAPDLADRIVARALRTPRVRARLLPLPLRHSPRRRAAVWSAVFAANVIAAAAAAASWDGQRFDFRRLVDLPQRVVAAVRPGQHHQVRHSTASRENSRPAPQIASVSGHVTEPAPRPLVVHSSPVVIAPRAVPMRTSAQADLHLHGTARARFQRQGLAAKPFRSVSAAPGKEAEWHRQSIASRQPAHKPKPGLLRAPQSEAVSPKIDSRAAGPRERAAALADRQQSPAATSEYAKADENAPRRSEGIARPGARQAELERHWKFQLFRHMHPRQRGGRFRRRF